MTESSTPIVIVAYNRPKSLLRLLKSLEIAHYPKDKVELIISIDFSTNNNKVIEIANDFVWHFGTKKVVLHKENLGLKKHILLCGDYALSYGNVIILEDDLYVSTNFYYYALKALKFSVNKDYIGGISLYNHKINVHTKEYFSALEDGYDNWYFQFASSWGQAWTKQQWENFKEWYSKETIVLKSPKIPKNVSNWSDKSWLKYFIVFLIETERYFSYPKISLTSNFSDQGTHVGNDSTAYQSELLYAKKENYNFASITETKAVYDAFYESLYLINFLGYTKDTIEIDCYGYKPIGNKKFLLTSKILNYKIINSVSRSLKPIETNFIANITGAELFVYDLESIEKNKISNTTYLKYRRLIYSIKLINTKAIILLLKKLSKDKIKRLHKIN